MIWWKWAKTTTALRICLWRGLMVYPFCNASESCMRLCIVPSLILCHVYATVATHVVLSGHEMDNPQSYKIKLQNLQYSNVWLHLIKKYPPCLSAIDIHIQWLFLTVNFSMCMLQPTKKKPQSQLWQPWRLSWNFLAYREDREKKCLRFILIFGVIIRQLSKSDIL